MTRGGLRLAAIGMIATACVLLLEIFCALYSARFPSLFRQALDPASIRLADARRFFEAPTFDPDLGWDADPSARPGDTGAPAVAQSYGDSFTRGAEVGSTNTWQARFRARTGRAIVNLGVNGYGLDQAVLKHEKLGGRWRTPVAILGVYPEEYRRADSWYAWTCFASGDPLDYFRFAFKPMFLREGDGWRLREPPCRGAACAVDLLRRRDAAFERFLTTRDRCARENLARPPRRFPYTLHFLEAIGAYLRSRRAGSPAGSPYFDGPESLERAEFLIRRFAAQSLRRHQAPLVLLLYSERDLALIERGRRPDAALMRFLEENRIPFVDGGAALLAHRKTHGGRGSISAPMGHLTAEGNAIVAEALSRHPLLQTLPPGAKR